MPSQLRILLPQSYYHIMTRGNNRGQIFHDKLDYEAFLERLARYKKELPFDLFHYCLMPNHVHLLIRTKDAADFSLMMKKLDLSYYRYYKERYGWVGHFWQGRFKSQPVGKDEYFIQCGKYIELNPVRASLVGSPGEYPYSSYTHYAQGKINNLVTNNIFYAELGIDAATRQETYRKLVVSDNILGSYTKSSWGTSGQRHNEDKKLKNHLK